MKKAILTTLLAVSFMFTMVMNAHAAGPVWLEVYSSVGTWTFKLCFDHANNTPYYDIHGEYLDGGKEYNNLVHGSAGFLPDVYDPQQMPILEIAFQGEAYEVIQYGPQEENELMRANYNIRATLEPISQMPWHGRVLYACHEWNNHGVNPTPAGYRVYPCTLFPNNRPGYNVIPPGSPMVP
jgi:hypothetical protein